MNLSNDLTDITYHFPSDVVAESSMCRKLLLLPFYSMPFIVTQYYANRDDLISKKLYGNESYGWILLFVNGLTREELIFGTSLNYPPMEILTQLLIEYDKNK